MSQSEEGPTIQMDRFHVAGLRDICGVRIRGTYLPEPFNGYPWVLSVRPTQDMQYPAFIIHVKDITQATGRALHIARAIEASGVCKHCGHAHWGQCHYVTDVSNGWATHCNCCQGYDLERYDLLMSNG